MKHELKMYSSSWCGTCRLVKKKLEDEGIPFEHIDVDAHQDEADKLGITNIPVIIAYKNGKEDGRWDDTKGDVISWIKFLEW